MPAIPQLPHLKRNNTYIMDAQNAAEMSRLMLQNSLITESVGGLFPEHLDPSTVSTILDLACGPGSWALQVAAAYPDTQVTGIDIDRMLSEYARTQALAQHVKNVRFKVMDAMKPLKFPNHTFDFVNGRLLFGFMLPAKWPKLIAECSRIIRPGGILHLLECELPLTNSPAVEQMNGLMAQALKRAGQSYSPDGHHIGIIPMLERLLRDGGFQDIRQAAYAINFSTGTADYEAMYQNVMTGIRLLQPFLLKTEVVTEEECDCLYERARVEMQSSSFCAVWFYLSAWGKKPAI